MVSPRGSSRRDSTAHLGASSRTSSAAGGRGAVQDEGVAGARPRCGQIGGAALLRVSLPRCPRKASRRLDCARAGAAAPAAAHEGDRQRYRPAPWPLRHRPLTLHAEGHAPCDWGESWTQKTLLPPRNFPEDATECLEEFPRRSESSNRRGVFVKSSCFLARRGQAL